MRTRSNDNGQAVMLGLMWVAVAAILVTALIGFAARLGAAHRAQQVADAVALAAVDGDRALGERIARLDGGRLVAIEWSEGPAGMVVEVVVRVGTHTASASASRAP